MTLQAVRAYFETPVMLACVAQSVPFVAENQPLLTSASNTEQCRMSMSFGDITTPTLGESIESLNGSFVVELFTVKNEGPGRAQVIITDIMTRLNALNTCDGHTGDSDVAYGYVGAIAGPLFDAPDDVPHFYTQISFPFRATYNS
jgi:hypothetical protein